MRILTGFMILLMGSTAFAANESRNNIFNADLYNSDLAELVTSFEQVCLPFVLHKTETTRSLDKAHFKKRLDEHNFSLQSYRTKKERYLVEPSRNEWKPPSQALRSGQFTIFNDISEAVIHSTKTTILSTGEVDMRARIPAKYRTMTTEVETYSLQDEDRLTARLGWNYPSQNHPGKSCEIRLDRASVTLTELTERRIKKDNDWRQKKEDSQINDSWSQCIREEDGEFLFTVIHRPETVSIAVKRDDFFTVSICGEAL